mgnify:CR=1 FL=1
MPRVNIKPLSVNNCWQGKRFKTPAYTAYEKQVLLSLKPMKLPAAPYQLKLKFGFSNKASDIDNPCKPLIDILQKRYKFNDKEVYMLIVEKEVVKKGAEYFEFELTTYKP